MDDDICIIEPLNFHLPATQWFKAVVLLDLDADEGWKKID